MKQNNSGYSLVEIVIVIAIMTILTGGIFFSVNMVFGANAKTCANDLRGAIAQTKVNAMGKSEAKVKIYRSSTNQCIYAQQYIMNGGTWEPKDPEKIGNAKVYVAFTPKGGTETPLNAGDSIEISFNRSSGSFKPAKDDSGADTAILYEKLDVSGGNRSFTVVLTELTGKVSVVVN